MFLLGAVIATCVCIPLTIFFTTRHNLYHWTPAPPGSIRLSGLPLTLMGYNTVFVKTSREENGAPVYELSSYLLFGVISIIGCEIYRKKSGYTWALRHTESQAHVMSQLTPDQPNNPEPVGRWSSGATCEKC